MKSKRDLPWNLLLGGVILALGLLVSPKSARANVYATNIRINDGTTNIIASNGDIFTISYVLNEQASLGVSIQLRSGVTVISSLDLAPNTQGTIRGLNAVPWDTTSVPVPAGTYTIAVITRSSGFAQWTQITSDTDDANTYVYDGRGIAIDRNPNSPYYGRIFVSNSSLGFNPATNPGDTLGILKFNADTSGADEVISSAGLDGRVWSGNEVSPWKLAISADDFVYVDDLATNGEVLRWDPTISSNSLLLVLRQDNQPDGAALSGPAIVGTGPTAQIWMGDTNQARLFKWGVNSSSVCALGDTGSLIVSNSGPNLYDVALDSSGNIYTCAYIASEGDPSARVFRYHGYDPSTNNALPETNADWAVGAGDDTYAGACSVALSPNGAYLAVSFEGPIGGGFNTNGNTKILSTTTGGLVANLDFGMEIQGDATHDDTACAWDAVGNVYYIDNFWSRWRAVSPPGTNQATTIAQATIQMTGSSLPPSSTLKITGITISVGQVTIDFSADTNSTASMFSVFGSATANGTYSKIASASVVQTGSGLFQATFPLNPSMQYFRIVGQGTVQPPTSLAFTKVAISGANLVMTFAGSTSDTPNSFTLLGAATVNATYLQVTNPNIVQVSPGLFQATEPISGPTHFYRVRK
jgi:hypothetical protein